MSYISQAKIYCPTNVKFELKKEKEYSVLWVSGDSGTWFLKIKNEYYNIQIIKTSELSIKTLYFYQVMKHYLARRHKFVTPTVNTNLSLLCVLIKRMVIGAGVGYKKYLRVRGVGYKFELQGLKLTAKVGYTHLIKTVLPYDFTIKFSRKSKVIRIRNKSLHKITNFISYVRSLRKPDIYKGKGIRYKRDPIRRKPGKRKIKAASKKRRIFNKRKPIVRRRKRKKRIKKKFVKKQKLKMFLARNLEN